MNIHIVSKEPDETRILSRVARILSEETGWSLGKSPRQDADLNLFIPYLDFEPVPTKTAAWFTHLDKNHQHKAHLWNIVAQKVDVRLTSTTPYLNALTPFGLTVKVPVPLDRKTFQIADSAPPEISIGVAGYSYHDNRKGEDLVRQLARDFKEFHWKAIGRGWSVPTQSVTNDQLPAFYQSLRLFVCASRIEGVPYPPLEALACGIPVVIPRHVGLLDDLPDMPGITRFEAGDYESLKAAFAQALTELTSLDRDALRATTEPYTPQAWAKAYERAFEDFLSPPDAKEELPDWHGRSGMYCVAYGENARHCAQRLLSSWQTHMPGIPSMLASSQALGLETVFCDAADYDVGGRLAKLSIDRNSPAEWQYVLYLDADTELIAPVPFLFETLQKGWDFVIATNPGKYHSTRMMQRPDNKDEVQQTYDVMGYDDLLQLNGGVFAYRRNSRTKSFFEAWIDEWMQNAKRDQAALLRALWKHPLKVCVLTNAWNTFDEYNDLSLSAGILHHQREARRTQGIIWERGDSVEAFKKVMK